MSLTKLPSNVVFLLTICIQFSGDNIVANAIPHIADNRNKIIFIFYNKQSKDAALQPKYVYQT